MQAQTQNKTQVQDKGAGETQLFSPNTQIKFDESINMYVIDTQSEEEYGVLFRMFSDIAVVNTMCEAVEEKACFYVHAEEEDQEPVIVVRLV